MKKLTHTIQFDQMEFESACQAAESFCAKASLDWEDSLVHARALRAEAREKDRVGWVPEDGEAEGEEEVRVAQEDEWPLIEGYHLIGLFGLVFLASRFDKFLEDVMRTCGCAAQRPSQNLAFDPSDNSTKSFLRKLKYLEDRVKFSRTDCTIEFLRIQEIFLARNDFLHNRGYAGKDYLRKIQSPRFLANDGSELVEVNASTQIPEILSDLRQFAEFIGEKCIPFSRPIWQRKTP